MALRRSAPGEPPFVFFAEQYMRHQCQTCNHVKSNTKICRFCGAVVCKYCADMSHGLVAKRNRDGTTTYTCAPNGAHDMYANPFTRPLLDELAETITLADKDQTDADRT